MTRDRARKKKIRARMAADGEPYSVAARKLSAQEHQDTAAQDHVAVRDIIARTSATLAAPSARIEFRFDWATLVPWPAPARPGLIGRLARRAARAAWERIGSDEDPAALRDAFAHPVAVGFLEPAAGRYQIDWGHYAAMYVDGKRFEGPSGVLVQGRHSERRAPEPRSDPLALLRLPQGATGARHAGEETLRGTPCRVVAVTVPGTASGPGELTVWLDDEHIRQVRFEELTPKLSRTTTLELWDFGVPVDAPDRSHLPSFRSPGSGPAS